MNLSKKLNICGCATLGFKIFSNAALHVNIIAHPRFIVTALVQKDLSCLYLSTNTLCKQEICIGYAKTLLVELNMYGIKPAVQ